MAFDFGTLDMRAMQIAEYLIERGAEFKSGDTIGPEKFKMTLADDGVATSGAIYQMNTP